MKIRRIETLAAIGLFAMILISQPVQAEIFKWVDDKGAVHFTDDPATIPEKYREKTGSRMTEEDLMISEEREMARTKQEQEVRERLMKEKKVYGADELERRVKEEVDKAQKKTGKCRLVSYSSQGTNVNLVIQNNDRGVKIITQENIIAITSRPVVTKWKIEKSPGRVNNVPAETKSQFNPKPFLIQLQPGETYRGSISFDLQLPIAKIELQGL